MRIYKDFNKVYLENYEPSQIIEIFYNGFFSGDMVASGNIILTENKIFLINIELDRTNVLFTYDGNFTIKKTYAYIDGQIKIIRTYSESDDVNTIQSTWNESTSKYTDFFRTNRRKPYRQTILRKRK